MLVESSCVSVCVCVCGGGRSFVLGLVKSYDAKKNFLHALLLHHKDSYFDSVSLTQGSKTA